MNPFAEQVTAEAKFNQEADQRAYILAQEGGVCDVSPEWCTLFDVTLKDGRKFMACGIHGSGGSLRGSTALVLAHRQVFGNGTFSVAFPTVRIYLVERAFGNRSIHIPRENVLKVELYRPENDA